MNTRVLCSVAAALAVVPLAARADVLAITVPASDGGMLALAAAAVIAGVYFTRRKRR